LTGLHYRLCSTASLRSWRDTTCGHPA
jgi:hypothetical protein